ncbi:hypothetical protein DJ535_05510 [Citrobacter murliniae]|uniref:Uncharacterized protein n=1 Tax=Citrobacter murliniae TaxID=67829 RepID=A0ABY2PYN4_9ENTR|nr:hypothetical protein DJ535_05510 [Citrobacter murliniae]
MPVCPGYPGCQTDREPGRWGNYCAGFVQIALGYSISWQSSFFHTSGLGYHVDHSATGLQQLRLLRVFLAIRLDAIRCWDLPLH